MWDLVRPEADFLFKLINSPVEFLACVFLEHLCEICVAELPRLYLIFRILKLGNRLVHLVASSNIIDLLTAFAVGNISKPGMVSILNSVALTENPFTNQIKIFYLCGKPGNFLRAQIHKAVLNCYCLHFMHSLLDI